MIKEFRDFAMKGNVVDMAVGVIVGTAFGAIVKTLVGEVLMPPLGLLVGGIDFSNVFLVLKDGTPAAPYATIAAAKEAGAVVVGLGLLLNDIVSFVIVAGAVFLSVKGLSRLKGKPEAPAPAPTTKECPECLTAIPVKANRCAACCVKLAA